MATDGGELITIGLGSYGTLAAAHWCNATTRYDQEHRVVYREHRGGTVGATGASAATTGGLGVTSVPRLLLLDCAQPSEICEERVFGLDTGAPDDASAHFHGPPDDDDERSGAGDNDKSNNNNKDEDGFPLYDDAAASDDDSGSDAGAERANATAARGPDAPTAGRPRGLFSRRRRAVPWWTYIGTPLHPDTVTTLDHGHRATAGFRAHHAFAHGAGWSLDAGPCELFSERCRRQFEACDAPQGAQVFVDADSSFGGFAAALAASLRDDVAGPGAAFAVHAAFPHVPLRALDAAGAACDAAGDAAGAAQHRGRARHLREECALNRALATHGLGLAFDLYTPFEVLGWTARPLRADAPPEAVVAPAGYADARLRAAAGRAGSAFRPATFATDDVASAAVVAATADVALSACRQSVGSAGFASLGTLTRLLRPAPSMRVAVAASTVARPDTALLPAPGAETEAFREALAAAHAEARRVKGDRAAGPPLSGGSVVALWDVLRSQPLLADPPYAALSHAFPVSCAGGGEGRSDATRVLSHAFALRGFGALPDETYQRGEAILRHAYPLGTDAFHGVVADDGYAVSASFPDALLSEARRAEPPRAIPACAHLVNTLASAPYLHSLADDATLVVRRARHRHRDTFEMEDDEWRDVLESLYALRDAYDYGAETRSDDEGGD